MVEAKHQLQLGRALARWARYDLIALDEVGYVPLAEVGAEFLFQVIAERAEKAAVIVTTNLPFSRMDHGDSQCPVVQGADRSYHRPRQHHRDRDRILSVQAHAGETQNQSSGHQDLIRVPGRFVKFYTLKATGELLNGAKLHESSQLTLTFMKIGSGELSRTMPQMVDLMDERRWL